MEITKDTLSKLSEETILNLLNSKEEEATTMAEDYCIVRTYSAGVFAGVIESRVGKEAVVRDARRLWYWEGAASLSQLSIDGVKCPDKCKFPAPVDKVILTEVIEIIPCTEKAKKSIGEVAIWQQ